MIQSKFIRKSTTQDLCRIAEIEIFNYRLHFYPIFREDAFYFEELQVSKLVEKYEASPEMLENTYVYDDGVVKGFVRLDETEVKKLFVEPVLQDQGIGGQLLEYVIRNRHASWLWALERNARAIRFYERHGFCATGEKVLEEGTAEYLVKLER